MPCAPFAVAPLPPAFRQCGQKLLLKTTFRALGWARNPCPITDGRRSARHKSPRIVGTVGERVAVPDRGRKETRIRPLTSSITRPCTARVYNIYRIKEGTLRPIEPQ